MSFVDRSQPAEHDDDAARMAAARTDALRITLAALGRVTVAVGSGHRRFVVDMQRRVAGIGPPLTERQEQHVLRLAWRYRRQMPAHMVLATNPDDPLATSRATPWHGRAATRREVRNG